MRIELPGGIAANIFKAVGTARGRDAMRQGLTGVNWEIAGGVHTFTATDSFRLHTVLISDPLAIHADSVLLSGDIVKAVISCGKATGKNGNVLLERFDGFVNVSAVNDIGANIARVTVECLAHEFPQCRSIIDGATEIELPARFDGKYLAGLIDAATVWAGKNGQVSVESIHARKPARVSAANDYGTFTGIVMPQRVGK